MHRLLASPCICLIASAALAQGGMSQARLQDDCLQRLRPIVPAGTQVRGVDFSALGHYATYYVVTWRFSAELAHGQRAARCTYRREGTWVSDDAAAYKMAKELAPRRSP